MLHIQEEISLKFNESDQFSTSSVYHAQFIEAINTNLNEIIWSAWAPPKCNFFSWLAVKIKSGPWIDYRWGWPHNPACVLCRIVPETGMHLFSECRFIRRICADITTWLAEPSLYPHKLEINSLSTWVVVDFDRNTCNSARKCEILSHPCLLGSMDGVPRSYFHLYLHVRFEGLEILTLIEEK